MPAKAQLAAIERKVKEVELYPHPQVSLRVNFAFLTSREIRRLEIDTELVKNFESLKCCFLLFQRIGIPLELSSPFEKRSGSPSL